MVWTLRTMGTIDVRISMGLPKHLRVPRLRIWFSRIRVSLRGVSAVLLPKILINR